MIFRLDPSAFVIGGGSAAIAAIIGAIASARSAANLAPAEAMSPAPPTVYSKGALQRAFARIHFDEPTRMILRHVTRWPIRAAVTVVGVAAAQALLVGTLFAFDAIDEMLEQHFDRTDAYDAAINFVEPMNYSAVREIERLPGVLSVQPNRDVSIRIRHGQLDERVWLVGVDPTGRQRRLLDDNQRFMDMPEHGLALSSQLASMVVAGVGDRVTLEVLEGERPVLDAPVTAIVNEAMGWPAFMDVDALSLIHI